MKKKVTLIVLVIVALSLTSLFTPDIKAESKRDQLKKELNKLQSQQSQASKAGKDAEKKLTGVRNNIKDVTREINNLDLQLEETENKIATKEQEISETEIKALEAAQLLDEAIARVEARDELLKKRVRAMYETGDVSYLEALLDSSSIGDFLSRVDMMEKVVDSDKNILAENIADKEEIEARKLEIDAFLVKLNEDYEELNAMKADLENKYKQKTVFIASLEDLEEELIKEIERQDEEFRKLAKAISDKNLELKKLEYSGGLFTWPVPDSTRITSDFGTRIDPITGKKGAVHNGTDIGAPQGTTIVAAADGEVILAQTYGTYGNCVMVDHGGIVTLYAHIRNGGIKVKVGDQVKRGQKIAEVGSTGRSTGPHLHFSVIKDGQYVDPMKYLKGN